MNSFDYASFHSWTSLLCYIGAVEMVEPEAFHSKCDDHYNTLTILKARESSFIFGSFTSAIRIIINQMKMHLYLV